MKNLINNLIRDKQKKETHFLLETLKKTFGIELERHELESDMIDTHLLSEKIIHSEKIIIKSFGEEIGSQTFSIKQNGSKIYMSIN
jgi:hypothetical protein